MAFLRNPTGNLRRYVLTAAVLVMAAIFLWRDSMARDWSQNVQVQVDVLVAGTASLPDDPSLAAVHQVAVEAIGRLAPPVNAGAPLVSEDRRGRHAVVSVAGAQGNRVVLTWAGRPPAIIDVSVDGSMTSRTSGMEKSE